MFFRFFYDRFFLLNVNISWKTYAKNRLEAWEKVLVSPGRHLMQKIWAKLVPKFCVKILAQFLSVNRSVIVFSSISLAKLKKFQTLATIEVLLTQKFECRKFAS